MSQMFLNVVSTFKGDGIQQANRQLSTFGKQTSSFGSILGKAATALASFGLAAKAIQFSRESITAARDLERNLFALDTIFTDLAPGMRQFAIDAENLGLSQSKAAKASTFIGSVLKQSGFAMEDVAKETKNLVELGTDLAALYGYDVQEALLGMTALFRGEYDPIEKFGVAMKQAEINAELAARGQNNLEGAARRNAEQTVRLELLYQRANDAMGAFTAQSGSLYTEQKKLGATFENLQAQLGTALLPAIVGVNEELRLMLKEATPGLIEIFEALADGLEALLGIFRDAMDPTTDLGESFAALGIQFNSLWNTLFGRDFNIAQIFEAGAYALGIFIDLIHDLLLFVENTTIGFQVMGEQIGLLLSGKFQELLEFDAAGEIRKRIDFKDTINTNQLALSQYKAEWEKTRSLELNKHTTEIQKTADAWERALRAKFNYTRPSGLPGSPDAIERWLANQGGAIPPGGLGGTGGTGGSGSGGTGGSGGGSSAVVKEVLSPIQQLNKTLTLSRKQAEKQSDLLGKGLAQGVVDNILSMSKPVKAANDIIKGLTKKNGELSKKGVKEVARLNSEYAAGIEQVNQRAAAAAQAANAAAEEARRQAEELRRAEEARIEGLNQLYANFLDTIKGTFAGIRNAIQGAFDITGLGGSTNAIIRNMNKLLAKMKSFSANVKSLATMGLDPALLQQVIQAGPVAGSRLAAALVSGGAGALASINAGFGQVGSLASEIAETGVRSLFDTQAQQNQYNITVTGGVGSGATIGKAIVDAIKDYERTSGAVWQGA
jgi:hypothetical protein